MPAIKALDISFLYRYCDPSLLEFETTAEITDSTEIIGQSRAKEALEFGVDIKSPGFNLFVHGEPGSGRHSLVSHLLENRASTEPIPSDWCYVNNFAEPNRPRLLELPTGRGLRFKEHLKEFVSELSKVIPAAFEDEEYGSRIDALHEEFKKKEEEALNDLGESAMKDRIALLRTPQGFAFAPMLDEKAMSPAEFDKLPEDEKERLNNLVDQYTEQLKQLIMQFPRWRRELLNRIKKVNRETLGLAVGHLIEELLQHYSDLANVQEFLSDVLRDIIEVGEQLREQPKTEGDITSIVVSGTLSLNRYQVNLLVDNSETHAAPVIYEDDPIFPNLAGRLDHIPQLGMLVTNFTMIKPGALHRANGGYLVLDALKVLTQPYSWECLKRALRSNQVRIESPSQAYGLLSTISLEPEPMPLNVKVVLVGDRHIYYLLKELDPDFEELFKITADFEDDMERDDEGIRLYARFIATLAQNSKLLPFERAAVARVIEHSSRLAGDSEKLTTSRRLITDLLQEANQLATRASNKIVTREDIEHALMAQTHRADRLRSKFQEEIIRGNRIVTVSGEQMGQINGLAVVNLVDFVFAHPVRITATVRLGDGNVIDIERESELGGSIHSKGVMILTSFLGARFSRLDPFSLSASLVFEQSYGPVEGDSASLAELCALMSSLAGLPIKQSLAVTGSVNQYGQVQAIGAVNEKIEGFFDICNVMGLTGDQGVLIPAANIKHLMLKKEVVKACTEGKFYIYPVENADQAIELLTGTPAGKTDEQGLVPSGTVNFMIAIQLAEMSALRRSFAQPEKVVRKKPSQPRAKKNKPTPAT